MILIIDDDRAICTSLKLMLKGQKYKSYAVHHPNEALLWLESNKPRLILLDMNFSIDTSGRQGIKLLHRIHDLNSAIPIILITGWGTLQLAVEGMKAGAKDFITKPWDNKHMLNSINTILTLEQKHTNQEKKSEFENIIGEDPEFLNVLDTAKKVSTTNASVLIMGDSGTGKELIAEAIHYNSKRRENPFVKVNLGGISQSLFESEMFGHIKGAFTDAVTDRKGRFEMAHNGTVFLDEIGDLDLGSQVKLLRVLQEKCFEVLGSSVTKEVDIRVVSATNKNLAKRASSGLFREDLFYRINLITLSLPSLKDRKSDIPQLVKYYIKNIGRLYDREDIFVDDQAMEWLMQQNFPGNIRQLKNLVERTLLMTSHHTIKVNDFKQNYEKKFTLQSRVDLPDVGAVTLEFMEVEMIKKALSFHHNKISPTAQALGITRSALYRRLQKYNIPHESQI